MESPFILMKIIVVLFLSFSMVYSLRRWVPRSASDICRLAVGSAMT